MNIVFAMDGVLRSNTGELVTDGLILFKAMKVVGRVVLLTEMDRSMAEVWLMMNHLEDYDDLITNDVAIDPQEPLRNRQIAVARTRGVINFYIDADPSMVAEAMRLGITALLFTTPSYSRPEFRPDAPKGVRRWDDITAEKTRQQAMKAVDARLRNDDLSHFE